MQSMNLLFFMSFHLQAQAPTDADRDTQNGGQINEKSRDFWRTLAKRLSQSEYRDHGQSTVTYYKGKTLAL